MTADTRPASHPRRCPASAPESGPRPHPSRQAASGWRLSSSTLVPPVSVADKAAIFCSVSLCRHRDTEQKMAALSATDTGGTNVEDDNLQPDAACRDGCGRGPDSGADAGHRRGWLAGRVSAVIAGTETGAGAGHAGYRTQAGK